MLPPCGLKLQRRNRGTLISCGYRSVKDISEMKFIGRHKKSLLTAIPDAHVLEWPGATHCLFITSEAQVVRELHAFIAGLH